MGLDTIELVLEIEDRYNIKLLDAECTRARTVGDLASLVCSRLPRCNDTCPTSRSFYRVRRLLVSHSGIKRRKIRPATRLETVFPVDFRQHWRTLTAADPSLPPLEPSSKLDGILLLLTAILIFPGLVAPVMMWGIHGPIVGIPVGIVLCVLAFVFANLAHVVGTRLPPEIQTVGDLARVCVRLSSDEEVSAHRRAERDQVVQEIRRITAQFLGLPLEKVRADSDFVRDLGC